MGDGMLLLIAGGVLLILYLCVRLWVAEHDRAILLESRAPAVVPDYGAAVVVGMLFLFCVLAAGIGLLLLMGII